MKNIGQGLTYKISVTPVYLFRFWKNLDYIGWISHLCFYRICHDNYQLDFSFNLDDNATSHGGKGAIQKTLNLKLFLHRQR